MLMEQFGFSGAALSGLKHKILRSYSQALPIHAKTGREWEPENACSFTDLRMTILVVGEIDFQTDPSLTFFIA